MEKDERFWLATALMSLYHADDGSGRGERFARLLERAGLRPPPGFPSWEDALAGALDLFFEVNLPSPARYRAWLRDHLGERVPIPYLKKRAEAPGARLEGTTRTDAMLLAANGVAVIFEAKVLSDISSHVTFDLARNQLARNRSSGRSTSGTSRISGWPRMSSGPMTSRSSTGSGRTGRPVRQPHFAS